MAALPDPIHSTAAMIYAEYERREADEAGRTYLGASILGHECERYLWLSFRWVAREQFSGRMLRLFSTGDHEEARLVHDLQSIGVTVSDRMPDGRQWSVSFCGGHGGGHLDAALLGVPEAPKTWHVGEFKTHNDKSFKELVAKGVRVAKPMHYAQMVIYAGLTGMDRMLYIAVNKNDDTIYTERLEHDSEECKRLMDRAARVIFASEPGAKLSNDAAFWKCKFCHFHGHCHGAAAPAASCRTCAHVTPERDGTWVCERHTIKLSEDVQRQGCTEHRVIPILLANWAEQTDAVDSAVVYRNKLTGHQFMNGPRPEAYSSDELAACSDKRAIGEPELKATRDEFEGRVGA